MIGYCDRLQVGVLLPFVLLIPFSHGPPHPRISDAELVNEHYRLEVAIYEVEEDLLLRSAPVCKRRDSSLPSELGLYLRDKGVRTLGTRQGCPAGRVLTWINATICKVLSCEAGRSSSVALNPSTGPLMGM